MWHERWWLGAGGELAAPLLDEDGEEQQHAVGRVAGRAVMVHEGRVQKRRSIVGRRVCEVAGRFLSEHGPDEVGQKAQSWSQRGKGAAGGRGGGSRIKVSFPGKDRSRYPPCASLPSPSPSPSPSTSPSPTTAPRVQAAPEPDEGLHEPLLQSQIMSAPRAACRAALPQSLDRSLDRR